MTAIVTKKGQLGGGKLHKKMKGIESRALGLEDILGDHVVWLTLYAGILFVASP